MPMNGEPFTDDHKARYLSMLRKTGNKSVSARAIGFAPSTVIRHRQEDSSFDADCIEALDEAADALEAEARRRAVEGVLREKSIGSGDNARFIEEYQYSDTLLIRLLEANKPQKFAQRTKAEISNPDGSMRPPADDKQLAVALASLLALAEARMREETK